nr:MAG TPA: thymidylate kinase [Caudoviricetes sp.]
MRVRTEDGRRKGRRMTAAYIALEGPDGVGKSTVAAALSELLRKRAPAPSRPAVRIRHFPTDALTACADDEGRRSTAEDYATDMENWLSFRPEPVLYPDAPSGGRPETLYILDRWALSAAVYASLRNERVQGNAALTLNWLNRVPLTTFVLMPRDPSELTDPDYPGPDPYDPLRVTEAYRAFLTNAFVAGELSRFIPIVVDRTQDTPDTVAAEIAEWVAGLQAGM